MPIFFISHTVKVYDISFVQVRINRINVKSFCYRFKDLHGLQYIVSSKLELIEVCGSKKYLVIETSILFNSDLLCPRI